MIRQDSQEYRVIDDDDGGGSCSSSPTQPQRSSRTRDDNQSRPGLRSGSNSPPLFRRRGTLRRLSNTGIH